MAMDEVFSIMVSRICFEGKNNNNNKIPYGQLNDFKRNKTLSDGPRPESRR